MIWLLAAALSVAGTVWSSHRYLKFQPRRWRSPGVSMGVRDGRVRWRSRRGASDHG